MRFALPITFALNLLSAAAFAEPPSQWIEPASGHKVVRLSREGGSGSLYFHQNAYTADGDKLLITTPEGLATVDLKTRQIKQVVAGRAGQVVVGRRTRQVFYSRDGSLYATHLDTGVTREIAQLLPAMSRGSGLAVNAEETLLVGSYVDAPQQPAPPGSAESAAATSSPPRPRSPGRQRPSLEERWAARLPMRLYRVSIATGELRTFHPSTDWLNHVQCSPTDPTLIMFCHEGPWHKVDRIWTIRSDGSRLQKIHARTMDMEIAGHEFFSPDGKIIWYDLQTPRGKQFWLAGHVLASGEEIRYQVAREHWSVHYNASPDGVHFAGDGGGPKSVAAPGNGQWIYLFTPRDGVLQAEKLVDLSQHNYTLEPNVSFTPDGKWIVFRSNMHGPSHVYAVEVNRAK